MNNIGWWFQLIGMILVLFGFIISPKDNIIRSIKNNFQIHFGSGDNIAGDKIIQKKLFSDTQYIKIWPSSLGGIDRLNLDNIATLKSHVPYNDNLITMLLNVVPIEYPSQKGEGFETQSAQFYQSNDSQEYVFDTGYNKSHKIIVEGRTFIVTLNKIKKVAIEKVSSAIEYEFGISETE